jgi:hypothetical protein
MQLSLKPYVTNGLVIAGAAALVAAPIAISPPDLRQPLAVAERTIAVEQKALINDLLNGFAAVSDATGATIANALSFIGDEPNFAARWVQALAQNPELAASIASWVVTAELLDFVGIPDPLITTVAGQLPPQLGQPIAQAYLDLLNFIDPGRLGGLLPDPTDGMDAVNSAVLPPLIDNLTTAFAQAFDSVGDSIWGALILVGQTPNTLLSVAQSAITDPADIPGLASYLAYSLINPFSNPEPIDSIYSLAIEPLIDGVIDIAPPPVGGAAGLVAAVKTSLDNVLTAILDALPAPVIPSPFVSPFTAPAQDVAGTEVVNSAAASQVVDLRVPDSQIADAEIAEGSGEQGQTPTTEPGDDQTSGTLDAGSNADPASTQQDTPEADDSETPTMQNPAERSVKHVRLNVKKVNPLADDLGDSQVGTTTKGSADQSGSGTTDTAQPVTEAPGDSDPAGAGDDNAGGEKQDEDADADQGAE